MSGSAEYCPGSGLSTKHVPSAQSVPVLTMQRGAGESPVAKGTGSCMAGLCSRTGGVIFAFKKDLVKSLPLEGRKQKSGWSQRPSSAVVRTAATPVFSQGRSLKEVFPRGNSPIPL